MAEENPTNQTEYLLIGGSNDGVRVKDNYHELVMIKRKEYRTRFTINFQDTIFEREYYRLTKFVDTNKRVYFVYIHEDCPNPMQLLIDKYPKPKDGNNGQTQTR